MINSELNWLSDETSAVIKSITNHFYKWLENIFLKSLGNQYWEIVKKTLNRTSEEQRNYDSWNSISHLDLLTLLKLADRNSYHFNHLASNNEFKSTIRNMKNVRTNFIGHMRAEGVDFDELENYLITIESFSRLIDVPNHVQQRVTDLKNRTTEFKKAGKGLIPYPGDKLEPGIGDAPSTVTNNNVKSFRETFNKATLTPSQIEAIGEIEKFIDNDDEQCFILKGYAGTGKTFLIGGIIKYLDSIHRDYCVMAPTGRATRVLTEQQQVNSSTIHRSIYYIKQLKEYEISNEHGGITYKYYYDIANNENKHGTIFIVDESSMISDIYSENEFIRFGSGRLLFDLLRYINFDGNDNKKKIIFVGDDAQLPPIGMNSSPALDIEYLKDEFNIKCKTSSLTDVIRQKEDSNILKLATEYRDAINQKRSNYLDFTTDEKEIIETDQSNFIKSYFTVTNNKVDASSIVITYSNSSASNYNNIIRETLFPGKNQITIGDQIMVVKNNYSAEIDVMNGQMGKVDSVDPTPELRSVPLNKGNKKSGGKDIIYVNLSFRRMYIKFNDISGIEHNVKFIVLENLLYNSQASITSDESKALYVEFRLRNPQLKPSSDEFKQVLKSDPYFNALQIKFGYAITCHKAQGGAWHNVFIDFSERKGLSTEILRWSYTAITRAEKLLYVTNIPKYSILRPINMDENSIEQINDEPELIEVHLDDRTEENKIKLPENFCGTEPL